MTKTMLLKNSTAMMTTFGLAFGLTLAPVSIDIDKDGVSISKSSTFGHVLTSSAPAPMMLCEARAAAASKQV